jgi:hypothetical protein
VIETNRDTLIEMAVQGEIISPSSISYRATWDGQPKLALGMGGIKYNLRVGDPCFGWASGDHVEPGVTIQGRERPSPSECALALFACIGNEARVVSGEGKGARGVFTGRHAGSDDIVWFGDEDLERLAIGDKVQVRAHGVGLSLVDHPVVRVVSSSPGLVEAMGLEEVQGGLVVPVTMEIPADYVGQGSGGSPVESSNWDVQTQSPDAVSALGGLRLGDIVLLRDILSAWGRGYYEGAATVGVVSCGASNRMGQGIGVSVLMTSREEALKARIDPEANLVNYLDLGGGRK